MDTQEKKGGGNMAEHAGGFQVGCKNCTAVKVDGNWTRSVSIVMKSMMLPKPLVRDVLCNECSGTGPLLGGFPRTSTLGTMLEHA